MKMLKVILLLSIVLVLVTKDISAKDGFLVHLSSKDPHRVSMALSFALKMAGDYDVFIFVDVEGVNAVLKEVESIRFKNFEATRTMIDKLLKSGVQIAACPMCLEALGHTQYDLISGIKVVDKKDFFNFTSGRIITLDY